MNYEQYSRQEDTLRLSCDCGWEGKADETYMDVQSKIVDLICPKCDKIVLILDIKIDPPLFGFSNLGTSYKDDAEKLINQFSSLDDPINGALHLCDELIWEYTHIDPNKGEVKYWESTKKALEKIRNDKK